MTNAEVLVHDLQEIDNEEIVQCIADYINCPSSEDCQFDGSDFTPCTDCKIKWLRSEFID